MTAQTESPKGAIQSICSQIGALPKRDQVSVLAQQIATISQSLTIEQRRALAIALYAGRIDSTSLYQLMQPQSVTAQRAAFIEKYQINALSSSQVVLTLPAKTTRIDFLSEAQALSILLHASNSETYGANQAISPSNLARWSAGASFSEETNKALSLKIDGNVKDSTNLTYREQRKSGWNDVHLQDLAIAHTGFYILTGKDLFEGNFVRAVRDALYFSVGGLEVKYFGSRVSLNNVSASRIIT